MEESPSLWGTDGDRRRPSEPRGRLQRPASNASQWRRSHCAAGGGASRQLTFILDAATRHQGATKAKQVQAQAAGGPQTAAPPENTHKTWSTNQLRLDAPVWTDQSGRPSRASADMQRESSPSKRSSRLRSPSGDGGELEEFESGAEVVLDRSPRLLHL